MRRNLFSKKRAEALLLLLIALPARGGDAGEILFETHGPLSSSPRGDSDKSVVFFGGTLGKEDEDSYLRKVNSGASPAFIHGPERIYSVDLDSQKKRLLPRFEQSGYLVNDPALVQPKGSGKLLLFFSRSPNSSIEACRKKEEPLWACPDVRKSREIAFASSIDNGETWKFENVIVNANNSGDLSAPSQPAAVQVGEEIWLYYGTYPETFMKENIFRLRLSSDTKKTLSEAERVKMDGFSPGMFFENPHLVRLKCPLKSSHLFTMVVNNRQKNAIFFHSSIDGIHFRGSFQSVLPFEEKLLASPTQMPGPASAEECNAVDTAGLPTIRELVYSEKVRDFVWATKRKRLNLNLP